MHFTIRFINEPLLRIKMAKKNEEGRYEQLKQKIESLNEKFGELRVQASDYVSEHPAKSTLAAFGIGVLAGAVLSALLRKR